MNFYLWFSQSLLRVSLGGGEKEKKNRVEFLSESGSLSILNGKNEINPPSKRFISPDNNSTSLPSPTSEH